MDQELNHSGGLAVFVLGTRAQLIKVAPVIVACQRRGLPARLLMTGQHRETMQDLIREFGIEVQQEAIVPEGEQATVQSLLRWLPRAFFALLRRLRVLKREAGKISVLVHGDTLSTVIGALAARLTGNRVLHLESGLSSGRLFDPFPEELSRRLVFRWTDVAFCPNPEAVNHMQLRHRCEVVDTGGNTIIDAVRLAGAVPSSTDSNYVVASLHRFNNIFDAGRLLALVELIEAISVRFEVHFVLHPATRKRLLAEGLLARLEAQARIRLSPRLGYQAFLNLVANAACVLTDGGSNQEELSVLGVPTIVMRERTERPDGLGKNAIMEADISEGVRSFVLDGHYRRLRVAPCIPGDDGPSAKIATYLARTA